MLNAKIIEQFNLLLKQIDAEYLNALGENDVKEITMHKFRLHTVKKIVSILRKIDFQIEKPSDLDGIPGIGKNTKKRIAEILDTGMLSEIKNKYDKKKQAKIDSIQDLEKIIGIGSIIAKKFVTKYNIRSVDELKKAIKLNKIKVSEKILLGLKYYGIVEGSIPRKEIATIQQYLIKIANIIDPELHVVVCGSYRRGKSTSGDVDLLMYHPRVKNMKYLLHPEEYGLKHYLELFVDKLTTNHFLLDHMTDKNYNMKYMGFCKYKNYPIRRIDVRFVPYDSVPTAMLHLTGPYELNQIMRSAAKKRHMILNEYGLYQLDKNGNRTQINLISEEEIFATLGMDYLTPEERELFSTGKIKKTKI